MNEPARPRPVAMVDVRCQHCHRRFGFAYPAPAGLTRCPGCGKPHEMTELEKLMGDIEDFEAQQPLSDAMANHISRGGTLDQLAERTGIDRATLRSFVISAAPLKPEQYALACGALGIEP